MYSAPMLAKELVAASTEPLILSLLSRGESYGYALIQEVKQLSGEKIEWTDGMLYPVLHRMEQNGWIKSRWVEVETGRRREILLPQKRWPKGAQGKTRTMVCRRLCARRAVEYSGFNPEQGIICSTWTMQY